MRQSMSFPQHQRRSSPPGPAAGATDHAFLSPAGATESVADRVARVAAQAMSVRRTASSGDQPGGPSGRPEVVFVGAECMHLWDLEVKTESFCCELIVHTLWRCPTEENEAAMEAGGDGLDETWEPDWFPRVKVWNICAELTERTKRFSARRDETRADVVWIAGQMTLNVKITEAYDLLSFPFDMQDLTLRLEVDNTTKIAPYPVDALNRIETRWRAPVLVLPKGVARLPDFELNRDVPVSYKYIRNELVIVFVYERAYQYHLWNSYALLAGIASISIAIWSLPAEAVESRLSLDITLLLVGIAFKQVLSSELPPVSYLTILDQYNLVAIFFVFVATLCHGALGFMEPDDEANGQTWTASGLHRIHVLDKAILFLYSSAWVCWNVYHVCFVRAQLHLKDVMTDPSELNLNGFAPAQMGEIDPTSGQPVADRTDENSVYGQYTGRSSRINASEVYGVIFGGSLGSKGLCCSSSAAKADALLQSAKAHPSSLQRRNLQSRPGISTARDDAFDIYAAGSPSQDLRGHLDMATQTNHLAPLEPNELYI